MKDAEKRELKQLFEEAQDKRRPHEDEIKEAFELVKPNREWRPETTNSAPDRTQKVDSTLARMTRNLVTNTVRLLIPSNGQWAKVDFRTDALRKRFEVDFATEVNAANDKLFRHFTDSGFYLATTEALYDEVIGGTMCVMFDDRAGKPLDYIPVPTDELFFLETFGGKVDVVFRQHEMSARQIIDRFGEKNLADRVKRAVKENPAKKFKIKESVVPDGGKFAYNVTFDTDWQKLTDSNAMRLNPFVVARWEKMLGHVWGNSPVRDAYLHQRVANAIRNDILRFGAYAALGLWQVNDETVNTENLSGQMDPGSVIAVDEPLSPVPFPGNFNLTYEMIGDEREQMKHIMFDSTPPSEDALKYMNDIAVSFLRQEFLAQVGEPATRLQREYLQPVADQAAQRLQLRGEITAISPDRIRALGIEKIRNQGDLFRIDVNAAIQRAQAAQEAQEIATGISTAQQVFGPQQVAVHVDMDDATRSYLIGAGVPESKLRKTTEVQKIKTGIEQTQAQLAINSLQQQAGRDPLQPPAPGPGES